MSYEEDTQKGFDEIRSMFILNDNSMDLEVASKKKLLKEFLVEYTNEVKSFINEQKRALEQQDEFLSDDEIYFMNKIDIYLAFSSFLGMKLREAVSEITEEEKYQEYIKNCSEYGRLQKNDLESESRGNLRLFNCRLKAIKEMSFRIYEEKIKPTLEDHFER